jgi:hypothetical protein
VRIESIHHPIRSVLGIGCLALSLLVVPGCSEDDDDDALRFSPGTLPGAKVGISYRATIRVLDARTPVGQISIADGALPDGLALQYTEIEDTARITGTPEEAGRFTFTISAWCMGTNRSGQRGEKVYSMGVEE